MGEDLEEAGLIGRTDPNSAVRDRYVGRQVASLSMVDRQSEQDFPAVREFNRVADKIG